SGSGALASVQYDEPEARDNAELDGQGGTMRSGSPTRVVHQEQRTLLRGRLEAAMPHEVKYVEFPSPDGLTQCRERGSLPELDVNGFPFFGGARLEVVSFGLQIQLVGSAGRRIEGEDSQRRGNRRPLGIGHQDVTNDEKPPLQRQRPIGGRRRQVLPWP